jgi:hypothetical protein
MYVNAKMVPVETTLGMRGEESGKESDGGVNSSMIYLMHCKSFRKCHNAPPPSTAIKKLLARVKLG